MADPAPGGDAPAPAGPARVIGVLGAGTMGAGIAQLACLSGARTLLHDPVPEALARGLESIEGHIARGVERGRLGEDDAQAARERLRAADSLADLAGCELVIEAAPESLELKRKIYAGLAEVVGEECVLATNTSSLPVTAIAAAVAHPERVVGMHFFNPPPLMKLLEIVAGDASDARSMELAHATGEAMGKRVIVAADRPGFIVNRCNRPFALEALRLLSEGIADVETIDRIVRLGGGFRMGPFELSDLVGIDVGMEISKSFYAQSFGEPRWRPSPIAQRMVDGGRHGRKSGCGYYDYSDGPHRAPDPDPPPAGRAPDGAGPVIVSGDGPLAEELRAAASGAGWDIAAAGQPAALGLILCDSASLAQLEPGAGSIGFFALPPFADCQLVELTRGPAATDDAVAAAEGFFASLGKHVAWVGDAPGLVLGRIVCQVINEAAFALGEGVGSAADIDTGMVLGLNHPHGPLEWADTIGLDRVLALLDGLWQTYREERYRAAPLLRRLVLEGRARRGVGAGFHEYDVA